MNVDEARRAVEGAGLDVIREERWPNETGRQLRLSNGAIVNVFDKGRFNVQGKIPHSLCLHFIVRCSDGSVLLLLNEGRKAYAGGTWSVSAEEQLKDSDLTDGSPLLALFKRAILEEVFGLSDDRVSLSSRWARIENHVHSLRLWSRVLGEHINNFSLLGVCQLSSPPATVREAVQ